MSVILSPRLAAAADMVPRRTRLLADVGTDHAYLPVSLVSSGAVLRAVASDINPAPLARAADNIRAAGLEKKIGTLLADGMAPLAELRPEVIVAAGMGGELIASMLAAAAFTRATPAPLLILQPMTRAPALRAYLAANGYALTDERLADEGTVYQLISARYDGVTYTLSPAELLCGKRPLLGETPLARRFVALKRAETEKIIAGRAKSAAGVPRELTELLDALDASAASYGSGQNRDERTRISTKK